MKHTVAAAAVLGAVLAAGPTLSARQAGMTVTITSSMQSYYTAVKGWLNKVADQVDEKNYGFKPAGTIADVRTLGRILAHVADANYLFCGAVPGMQEPAGGSIEQSKTTKAEITKALADSFAFCDRAWAATTDANAATPMDLPENLGHTTRLGELVFNTEHCAEHYGNLVTYMRALGLVPPSSQGGRH